MSLGTDNSVFQSARISFAFVGGVLLALAVLENSAQAGCGDYVFVRNASGQLVRPSSLMRDHGSDCAGPECPKYRRGGAESAGRVVVPEESVPIKLPCNGPNCSNRSNLPASPVPRPAPLRSIQESAALALRMIDGNHEANACFSGDPLSSEHELHNPQSIFHPPR